eukprot:1187210-Prymnesium_polylepis.1
MIRAIIAASRRADAEARGAATRRRFELALRLRRPYRSFLLPNEMVLLCAVVKVRQGACSTARARSAEGAIAPRRARRALRTI